MNLKISMAEANFDLANDRCPTPPQMFVWPNAMGQGHLRFIHLRDGLDLVISCGRLFSDCILEGHDHRCMVELAFWCEGHARSRIAGLKHEIIHRSGSSVLSLVRCNQGRMELRGDVALRTVTVLIDPSQFLALAPGVLPHELSETIERDKIAPYLHQDVITLEMAMVLYQIIHCPYEGQTGRLYLEAKTLEILALLFARREA